MKYTEPASKILPADKAQISAANFNPLITETRFTSSSFKIFATKFGPFTSVLFLKRVLPSILSAVISLGVGVLVAHAQGGYTPLVEIQGIDITSSTAGDKLISTYLSGAIKLLVAVGAAVAILMTIIGGTQYVAAGISPDAKSDAKSKITNSFIGLTLILTSYLILNSINPKLLLFDLNLTGVAPVVIPVEVSPYASEMGSDSCPPGDIPCEACSSCSSIPASVPTKKAAPGACYGNQQCFLDTALLEKIKAINIPNWYVTEAWPPTVKHESKCHRNGKCADLNNTNNLTDPTNIKIFYDAFSAAGLNVTYETKKDCAEYKAKGVTNCAPYPTMTNDSSFHVKL